MSGARVSADAFQAPLFVPGSRPERFTKALSSGADGVIIDLEDAVAAAEKQNARTALLRTVPGLRVEQGRDDVVPPLGVRVNGPETDHLARDVAMIADLVNHLDFVVLPQVRAAEDIDTLSKHLLGITELPVIALIESSRGLLNAADIAQSPGVRRLALGAADLSEEWEVQPSASEAEFDHARQMLVIASRAAGLNGPLDSPHMNVQDVEGLQMRMRASAQLGMTGKLCLHPRQVPAVRESLVVTAREYERLCGLISDFEASESAGEASIRLADGSFVDYPVYRRALAQVRAYHEVHQG